MLPFLVDCAGKAEGERPCGRIEAPREPSPAVQSVRTSVKGAVTVETEGSLRLTLSPIVDVPGFPGAGVPDPSVQAIDPNAVRLEVDASPVEEVVVSSISAADPALVDLVFLIDTSEHMGWAIDALAAAIERLEAANRTAGVEARYGGIEFADAIRTRSALGSATELGSWLSTLTSHGGRDDPSSGLDAIVEAYSSFSFRPEALRYLVVFTNGGFHERSDGSGCSNVNVKDVRGLVGNQTLVTIVSLGLFGDVPGVHAVNVASGLDGLFVNAGVFSVLQYDIAEQTPMLDDLLRGGGLTTLRVHPLIPPNPNATVRLTYEFNGEELSEDFRLNSL